MALVSSESVLNNIKESILIIDKNFNILNANSRLLDSLDLDEGDILGKPCHKVIRCGPLNETCPLSQVLKTGESSTKRRTHIDKSGNMIHREVTIYPLMNGGGMDKFIHIERDITERVRVEREIRDYIDTLGKKVFGTA